MKTHQILYAMTQYTPACDGSSAFTGTSRVSGAFHFVSMDEDANRLSNSSIRGSAWVREERIKSRKSGETC